MRNRIVSSALLLGFLLSPLQVMGQSSNYDVRMALQGAVQSLEETQQKETEGTNFFKGEWPSFLVQAKWVPLIGRKKQTAYDSNSFTVSSIHNMLASVRDRFPEIGSIPLMLDRAIERILAYQNGDSFNFWPLLEPFPAPPAGVPAQATVRRPNHFIFRTWKIAAGCNVFDDADDTAVALSALHRHEGRAPQRIGYLFSPYRDEHRHPHIYNRTFGIKNTGAFLTWLAEEHRDDGSTYLPSLDRPYMPFGQNDVDCVVNANILSALATYHELGSTQGAEPSCRFLYWAFEHNKQDVCGVYYPSPYNPHYAVAKAFSAGANCVKPALDLAVREILEKQNRLGYWSSPLKGDQVHTTLYALNTLLYAGNFDEYKTRRAIERGIEYVLHARVKLPSGAMSWQAGVFFSGGTVARFRMFWKSEAYTTALAAEALSLYLAARLGT